MEELSYKIFEIIKDYHCDEGRQITVEDVIAWAKQFDEKDQIFVLEEFLHILNQGIYISKEKAKELLLSNFNRILLQQGYRAKIKEFVNDTHFFDIQKKGKSQGELISMLREVVRDNYGLELNSNEKAYKNFIYLDDVVATGKTVLNDFKNWLHESNNSQDVINGDKKLILTVFCMHQWALSNIRWALKCEFENDEFIKKPIAHCNYLIENQVQLPSSKLNFAVPVNEQPESVMDYFDGLEGNKHGDKAFRRKGRPAAERFYSTAENRNRFESIMLEKGIEIVKKIKKSNGAHRPLGDTYPNYKTLGTGTLFFTWRNVSNTCPLVFWWDVTAHGWKGLFPLKGRGQS